MGLLHLRVCVEDEREVVHRDDRREALLIDVPGLLKHAATDVVVGQRGPQPAHLQQISVGGRSTGVNRGED